MSHPYLTLDDEPDLVQQPTHADFATTTSGPFAKPFEFAAFTQEL